MVDRDRLREGSSEYFQELMREFGPLVLDVARGFAQSEDEADDLFQDVWIRVWKKRRSYRGGPFRTWLLVVARNLARDRARRRSVYQRVVGHLGTLAPIERLEDPLAHAIASERRQSVRRVVDSLPIRQRLAIHYRLSDAYSTARIAELMEVSPATVRSLVSKGLAKILEDLKEIE